MDKPRMPICGMLVLLLLLSFLTACQPLPAATIPVAPVTPTATAEPVFTREFNDPFEPWCAEEHHAFGDFFCKDGELNLVAKGDGNIATFSDGDFRNFMIQARMRSIGNEGAYGVVFRGRSKPATYYIFQLRPTGQYELIKWSQIPAQNRELIPWTASDAIRQGEEPNELKVTAQGPVIALYVNDEKLASITVKGLASGKVGPVATQEGHAAVSYLKVWELPEPTQDL